VRLVCLPHAGAGASTFRGWPALLPPGIEVLAVQAPGREDRLADPAPRSVAALALACTVALRPYSDLPVALYGHCAGAQLAFEVAHLMRERHGVGPVHLFAAAHAAPDREPPADPVHALPDDEFVAALRRTGGAPEALLADAGMRELLLPAVRADFALFESYRSPPRPPLDCAITALRGSADDRVGPADLAGWAAHTTGGFRAVDVPGGHFFLTDLTAVAADVIAQALTGPAADLHRGAPTWT
jgi:medium-chain acyl-[acyl-carrier-protein] hydrolase